MSAVQARGQRRGVVGDDQIAGPQHIDERLARDMSQPIARIDDEQFRGSHSVPQTRSVRRDRQLAAIASSSSRAARLGLLQRRAIRVGHRQRVQRRVHVARIDREKTHALFGQLRIPDVREMAQRRFARAVCAPGGIRVHGGVARHVQHHRAAPFTCRCRQRAEQRLRQTERPEDVRRQRALEILALGIAEQRERRRAEIRRVVDQDVEAAQLAENLQRHRVDVVLRRDVADDAVRAGMLAGDLRRPARGRARRTPPARLLVEEMDERETEARGAAGDGDAQVGERMWQAISKESPLLSRSLLPPLTL